MENFSKKEIISILKDESVNDWLFNLANEVRKQYVGDEIHLRGLIEFTNVCKNACLYCGLRSSNCEIERYRLSKEDIISLVQKATDLGYKTIVLQGGEDSYYTKDTMCDIIQKIKQYDVALTLSIGERNYEDLKAFKKAGADRYLIRIETTDKNLYTKMHPHMNYEERINCLKNLKDLGYEVGTGCLVGLPEQTIESLADDILFFQEIQADMIGIGPFIPHPQTPLHNASGGSFTLALKVMALTRILLKDINIPATTAMETLIPNGRIIALNSGANVIMPNITTKIYSEKYEIYPGKFQSNEDPEQNKNYIENTIRKIGRTIATGYGYRKEKK